MNLSKNTSLWTRRAVAQSGLAALAAAYLPGRAAAAPSPASEKQVLLLLDLQVGIADQAYAAHALHQAGAALAAARRLGIPVIFSRVAFRPGYANISQNNRRFMAIKADNRFAPGSAKILDAVAPAGTELVVDKDRYSAFAGNDLHTMLRALSATHLVLAGTATGGVVLSTFTAAADEDFQLTVLADACADPDEELHRVLVTTLFPRSADVMTGAAWAAAADKSR